MSATREQAIEVLNAAKLASDGNVKINHLRGLLELVARKEPALLPEFLPAVLELQVDPSPAVKRFLADFLDASVAANPTPAVLQPSLACLRGLLADSASATVKRALQSCYAVFRTAYTLVALRGGSASEVDSLSALWTEARALKAAVLAIAAGPSNDGVRLPAVRFLEQIVMLLTAELVPAVAGVSTTAAPLSPGNSVTSKAALVRDAEAALGQLVAMLRQRELLAGSAAPLGMAVVRAAGAIMQQRPQFMGRLLPPMLALASSSAASPAAASPAAESTAQNGQGMDASAPAGALHSSITAVLKAPLLAVARSKHPSALPWMKKVDAALAALGETAARPEEEARPEKRQRVQSPQLPPGQHAVQPEAQPAPLEAAQGALAPGAAVPATAPEHLAKVLALLQALVASQDASMLAGVLGSLQPTVLADVVMAYMAQMPPRHMLPPDNVPVLPWIDAFLQLVAAQAPLPVPVAANQSQQQLAQLQDTQRAVPLPVIEPDSVQQAPLPLQAAQPLQLPAAPVQQLDAETTDAKQAPGALPKPGPTLAVPISFKLEPLPLTEQQQQQMRLAAVLRILQTEKTSRQPLRATLVSKLASQADGSMIGSIMQHVIQHIACAEGAKDQPNGGTAVGAALDVALMWLDVLFAKECKGPQQHEEPPVDGAEQPATRFRKLQHSHPSYDAVFMQLLDDIRQALPPSSRLLVRVLLEAPQLPMPAVRQFLQQLVDSGPEWCTLALLAARDVITQRPPNRDAALQFVLDSCCSAALDTRGKAIRLVTNRLFPDPNLGAKIELAASQRLHQLVPSQHGLRAEMATATQPSGSLELASGVALVEEPEVNACAAQQSAQDGVADGAQPAGGAAVPAAAPSPEPPPAAEPDEAAATQLCGLYCALCTKNHALLRRLFEVYGQTSDGGKAGILRNADGLAKTLGPTAPALLAVVQDPPPGSLPLLLHMLHTLTESVGPPKLLVTACLQLFDSCKDPHVLVPVLRGLDRATALRLLPALLELQPEQLRPALQRLVSPLATAPPTANDSGPTALAAATVPAVVSPEELLSAMHTLDVSGNPGLLRKVMQGVTVCIGSPALFPPEAMAACINQLMTRVPLPQLFMRTVIQTNAAAPKLRTFIIGVLRQLIGKQVWKDSGQWKGWILCAQQTAPDSFPVLVSLPAEALSTAVETLPGQIRQQLLEFANQGSTVVPSAAMSILRQYEPSV